MENSREVKKMRPSAGRILYCSMIELRKLIEEKGIWVFEGICFDLFESIHDSGKECHAASLFFGVFLVAFIHSLFLLTFLGAVEF